MTVNNLAILIVLVREWRDAQWAIDKMTQRERENNLEPLHRLVRAHKALLKFAVEQL